MERSELDDLRTRPLRWRGSWAPAGWLLVGLGAIGLLGWTIGVRLFVQPFVTRAPISPLAALGLFALGIGVLALDRKQRRITIVSAVVVMLIGCLALLQLATGMDLGFERLLAGNGPGLRELLTTPRMLPVASAIGFLLGGGALALIAARRIEEEREGTERRFRAIFDSAYHFQALLDLGGRVLEANPTAARLLGPAEGIENLRGVEFWQAPWWPTASVREHIKSATLLAREGQTVTDEFELQNATGDRLIFDLSLKPIRNAGGSVLQLLAEGRDITAGRRAEAQLREVEALSTMGRLAARVAHEINNPLAGIQNSFLLLRDAIPPQHPHYAFVGAMEREIGRIANVTRQLYETYRPEVNGSGGAGVRTLIGDAVALLEQVNRPSQVRIHAELEGVPSQVAIPESVLRQSVYNLVQNAVEASPPGGTVTVKASVVDSMFVLTVRDEGPGVPGELRTRIFQPFVSSKERNAAASGVGIGLSMVQRSVTALGGTISIADPPQGGAEFVVRIPLSATSQGAAT